MAAVALAAIAAGAMLSELAHIEAARRSAAIGLAAILIAAGAAIAVIVLAAVRAFAAERARREAVGALARTGAALEAAGLGLFDWRFENDSIKVSAALAAALGVDDGAEMSGEAFLAAIAASHRQAVRAGLVRARTESVMDLAAPLEATGQGPPRWLAFQGLGSGRDRSGRVERLVGVASDVTRDRQLVLALRQAEVDLAVVLEGTSLGAALFDRSGRLRRFNRAFCDLFGIGPGQLVRGARRAYVLRWIELALASPPAKGRSIAGEHALKNGRRTVIEERSTGDGGLLITARDATAESADVEAAERQQREVEELSRSLGAARDEAQELAQAWESERKRAEAADRARSDFLSGVSHELRTPLNAINGFSAMMVEEAFGPLGDPRYRQYAADILASGERLLALIDDVLDLSRVEAGRTKLNLESVTLGEVAADALRRVRRQARAADVAVVLDLSAASRVEADYHALEQVLLNLLATAIDSAPRNSTVRMDAAAADEGRAVAIVRVAVGAPAEGEAGTARSPPSWGFGGPSTPLGLALCRSLIELHGGALVVDSEAGAPLSAHFTLPLIQTQAAAA